MNGYRYINLGYLTTKLQNFARFVMGKSMPSKQNSENTYPVNWFTPKRKQQRGKRRRDTLDAEQLALLTTLEERNAVLLARRVNRDDRKQKLAQFAQEWRNGQPLTLGRAA